MSEVKEKILSHSRAKLDFYEKYLERYLAILSATPWIDSINIFDIFCGTGIYKDGNAGSPIIAFDLIEKTRQLAKKRKWPQKIITLSINDLEPEHVEKVSAILVNKNKEICDLDFNNLDATKMFNKVIKIINFQSKNERNLIFIDPYGYQKIFKKDILKLLETKKTEIILFLPISHMYRFKKIAVQDFDNPSFVKLRSFIYDFFPKDHPICKGLEIDLTQFIDYLKEALSFNERFFSASYYIQREKANYFSLFFITPNLLGFEKIIDVLWNLDKNAGCGFDNQKISDKKNKNQFNLLDIIDYRPDSIKKIKRMEQLDKIIYTFLNNSKVERNNYELTKLILKKSFRIKHANKKLYKLQKDGLIEVVIKQSGELARKGSFYLGAKNIQIKEVLFNLVK